MEAIKGMPYVEARFDKTGQLENGPIPMPAGTTDLIVVSHGWNNNAQDAKALYTTLFGNFADVAQAGDLAGRSVAIVGVIWPSKQFDELVSATSSGQAASGGAGLGSKHHQESDRLVTEKLDRMKETFTEPKEQAILARLAALLPELEDSGTARDQFVDQVRSLLDSSQGNSEDSSKAFFEDPAEDIMEQLKVDEDDLAQDLTTDGGSASLPLGVGVAQDATGGAAGFVSFLSGFKSAAMNVLNFATYYEMKARAGTVGKNGVGPLVDILAPGVQRIHLVGHSFGGRVMASAAANSTTDKLRSLNLLQSAFSHNGFSKTKKGFFRSVVDANRIKGPIIVTHTKNDKAVGIAYPLAARLNGEKAAALGDEKDEFGGIGRNGAQQMEVGEVVKGNLLPVASAYQFQPGKFFNLESSAFISGHSAVRGPEVAHVIRRAVVG